MNGQLALAWGYARSVREAGTMGLAVLLGLGSLASVLAYTTTLPTYSVAVVTGVFAMFLAMLLTLVSRHRPRGRFGAANGVTLVRVALVTLLLGFVGADPHHGLAWLVVGLATLAASLDALDGALARRSGMADRFGARFDMEADAALVLVLCLLTWQYEKTEWWVLLAGLMRYAFVLAGLAVSWLRASLPPSVRRQAVCVAQVVVLIVCLVPAIQPPWSEALAAAGLAALSVSFMVDIGWLARNGRRI